MMTWKLAAALGLFAVLGATSYADEWYPKQEDNGGSKAQARATIDYQEETRAGKEFVILTLKVDTRAGRGNTVRGYATYSIYKADGTLWTTMAVKKYSTAKVTQPDHRESETVTRRFLKSAFYENFVIDDMAAYIVSTDINIPNSADQLGKWVQDNASRELKNARDEIVKGVKDIVNGPNWSVRKKK